MQAKLTKRIVDAATDRNGRDAWVWDTEIKGFGLRVRRNGHRVYVLEYRPGAGGRSAPKRRVTIGKHGSPWTPEAARNEARRLLGIVAAGSDPALDKAGRKAAPTVADMAQRFLEEHADTKRKPATAKQYRRLLIQFIGPAVGRKKVADVTRQDVMRLHSGMSKTPYQANRSLALVSTMFNFAELAGERAANSNPAIGVERYREAARERILSVDELGWLGEAMRDAEALALRQDELTRGSTVARRRLSSALSDGDRQGHRAARRDLERSRAALRELANGAVPIQAIACFRLLLFTGARLGEILSLKWEWIDLHRGEARLPDSKTGRKTIHLPAPALDVLARTPRIDGNPYVITGNRAGAHLIGIQRPWQRIRSAATVKEWRAGGRQVGAIVDQLAKRLHRDPTLEECRRAVAAAGLALPPPGLSNLRIHDLRHAFASVAAGAGLGLPVIGKLLGHTQAVTTQRYAHLAADPLKAAAASIAGKIAGAMSDGKIALVVDLPSRGPRPRGDR